MQTFNKYVLNEWQGISGSKLSRRCRRICSKTANGKVVVNSTSSSAVSPKMPSHLTLGSFPGPIWTFLLSHHTYFHFLECEVKWALGSITTNKASGGDGILVEFFKSWKMTLWKCCTQYASTFGKLSSGHRTGKVSFHSNPKERQCQRMLTLLHNYTHVTY